MKLNPISNFRYKNSMILFLVLILSVFLITACTPKEPRGEDCLRFGVLRVEDALPLFVAEREGIFKTDVEIIPFSSSREMDLALEAGVIDGILTDMVRAILMKSSDTDIRIVAAASDPDIEKRRFALLSSPKSSVTSLSDINQHQIGTSANSVIQLLTEKILSENQISEKRYQEKPFPDLKMRMEALLAGTLDLALLPEPLVTLAEKEGARVLFSDNQLSVPYSQTVLIFRKAYLEKESQKVAQFLKTYETGAKLLNRNPGRYKTMITEEANIPEGILSDYPVSAITRLLLPEETLLLEINQWMLDKKMTGRLYAYEELTDSRYAGGK